MPTEESTWEILAGASVSATTTSTLIDPGSAGDVSCLRTLTHPDSANFPVVTYNRNPDRTINFDQVPLSPPSGRLLRTLETTQAFVTQNDIDDVVVTEIWSGNNSRASMVAAQFRRLYELSINPPEVADPENFIVWAPCDRSTATYNVIIVDLRVGGGSGRLDAQENLAKIFEAGDLDAVATGLIDRTVELDLKIVSEVVV